MSGRPLTNLGGDGFVAWHKFDHPQLGPVEIGGFDLIRYWYNIPFDRLQLTLPATARLVEGDARQTLGQLEGRSAQRSTATWWGYEAGTPDRGLADWIVSAPAGTKLAARASQDRAGSARAEITLQPKN